MSDNKIITRAEAKEQGLIRFFTGVPCKYGHISERYAKSNTCVICGNIKSREWNVAHQYGETWAKTHKKQTQQSSKNWRAANPDKVREYSLTPYARLISQLNQAKRRAKSKGIEFNITRDDIIIPDSCPVLGIPIERSVGGTNKASDTSPSIDRVDSNKGYTKDNICVISWRANRIKSDATLEELKAIVSYMEQHGELSNE